MKDTMRRLFATPLRATEANWGVRAAAAGSRETRASYAHAAAATSPTMAHRDTDLTSDIGASGRRGEGEHGPDSQGQQAALLKSGPANVRAASRPGGSLPHAKTREHAIQDVIGGDHADQFVERPHGGAQVRRRGGHVHPALPGGVECFD